MTVLRWITYEGLASPTFAQTPSGEISGLASDSSGSVLPGVRVTLINVATNATRVALRTPNYGVITSTRMVLRQIQLGLKTCSEMLAERGE